MGYSLKIKREEPIDFLEWAKVLEAVEFVRPCKGDFNVVRGPNGQSMRFPINKGDAEVYFAESDSWSSVFHFREQEGCISFRAPEPFSPENPIWIAAATLARRLDSFIVGQEGESYDLNTGKPAKK